MAELDLIQQLDQAVEAMFAGRQAEPSGVGPEVTELLRIAGFVRDLPNDDFRASLKVELEKEIKTMTTAATPTLATTSVTTGVSYIREGFRSITPYLHGPREAGLMEFLKRAFGAEEHGRYLRPDGSLMHGEVRIGDSIVELADVPADFPGPRATMLHLYVADVDAVYRSAMDAGAVSVYEPSEKPYGDREGGIMDPVGNYWFIGTHLGAHHIPEGLHSVTPGVMARGTPKYIDFLKQAFGAEEAARHESPDGTVIHAKIRIGDSIIETSEAREAWPPMPGGLHFYLPDVDAAYQRAINAGAVSLSEPMDQPYGERSATVVDSQGNYWYLASRTHPL
jgi:PhnB protein